MTSSPPEPTQEAPPKGTAEGGDDASSGHWTLLLRLVALAVIIAGLLAIGEATGLNDKLDHENIQGWIQSAGWWGALLYVALFSVGNLVQIPGLVFIAAAVVAYGPLWGGLLGWGGALVALSVSFWVVRLVGGKPLGAIKNARMRRMLDLLDERPLVAVIGLRTFFWMSPPLNYALSLSSLRYRDYLLGSAIGLLLPVLLAVALLDVCVLAMLDG